ncbi:glycosyltransferase family 39 protein [Symbioplanes lichenis]|uniref:glycosyltransferase family 39 protein n=1 Tax=Symbioplanes lichenis TaxID=1629072 RepID=UPI00273A193D|nr:glycosyltransferase family 39 protein [Actinoplanes lichenis]
MTATTLIKAEPAAPELPTPRRWSLVYPWLLPAIAMAVVGGIGLSRPALGWDEHATWSAAMRTPAQILDFAGNMDGVIAPYYLFTHFWTAAFGDAVGTIRLPSLIAVVLGTGLVGELGRRLFGPGTGLTAGLIVAAVPQLSRYAQDARAYGIAFFFAVLATLLLYVAVERPTWWRWAAYGAALTLLGATHMIGFLVLAGHVVTVALRRRDARVPIRWAVMVAAALLLVSPLIYLGLTQRGTQLEWIAPLDLHQVLIAPGMIFGAPAAGLLVIGLALAARWERPALPGELGALAAIPPILLIAVSFVTSPLWVPRYVLFVIAPLALLAAVALRGLRWRTVAALILIAAMGFEMQQTFRGPASHGGMDFRKAAAIVQSRLQPGDGVVYGRIGTWSLRAGLDYELRDSAVKPDDLLLREPAAEAGGLDGVECPGLTCFTTDRVWYVGARQAGDPMSNAGDELRAKFKAEYKRTGYWLLPLGTIALYERKVP